MSHILGKVKLCFTISTHHSQCFRKILISSFLPSSYPLFLSYYYKMDLLTLPLPTFSFSATTIRWTFLNHLFYHVLHPSTKPLYYHYPSPPTLSSYTTSLLSCSSPLH
uniref:Uncharacterized protein n=1 Tax=Cacopsylla melanoneura TaxID=428564 RepID=A0A8D8ZE24_9HEMI